ncbi:hypothetical protein HMI56_007583 [Coelomomyces lativittatus]|nr:hypothetical protein HMI56_007583 [Coelomomyces lativittatus]
MGHILPLDSSFPRINDRLFLGGPTSVRGFKSNSLGPRDKDDALGGTIGYQLGLSLYSPIPKLSCYDWLRSHLFINAGTLAYYAKNLGWPSVSTGIGIAVKHPVCRIELNWHIPLVLRKDDQFIPGFGFGIGVQFL